MKQTGAGGEHPRQEKQSRPWPRPGGRCAGEKAEAGRGGHWAGRDGHWVGQTRGLRHEILWEFFFPRAKTCKPIVFEENTVCRTVCL